MTTATQQPTPIDLDRPIPRGEGHINSITLRKPDAGALRGIVLSDLLRMEAGAVADLLPRITETIRTVPSKARKAQKD